MASYPQCITDISIHALLAESDGMSFSDMYPYDNFYPRSPCGERLVVNKQRPRSYIFLSTLSLRRATFGKNKNAAESQKFLSTLSLRRATRLGLLGWLRTLISIHALLAESDNLRVVDGSKSSIISIHALLAESDGGFGAGSWRLVIFLSTLSLRRATFSCVPRYDNLYISIHALLAESDAIYPISTPPKKSFLSTLSLRRATCIAWVVDCWPCNFYPRSPCGERLFLRCGPMTRRYFYPRSPCGERLPAGILRR